MGWFGCGPMDGDDPMDFRAEVFDRIGVVYSEDYDILTTKEEIRVLLFRKQNEIYEWLRDYNWDKHHNPGFTQSVYIQALAYIMYQYNVPILNRGRREFLRFIKNDHWAKTDNERKKEMQKLFNRVQHAPRYEVSKERQKRKKGRK